MGRGPELRSMNFPRGHARFFCLEGLDGSGKTTQIALLAEALRVSGYDVACVREPGGTALSDGIRALLLNRDHAVSAEAELLLFSAARAQLVSEVIAPALAEGKVVIADRFGWSTLAYQGFGRGLDKAKIALLFQVACGDTWPGHTFLLDLPVSSIRGRLEAGGRAPDRMEKEKDAFFEKVRAGYQEIAKENSGAFTVLDASRDPVVVQETIQAQVFSRLLSEG
jgi:dTMP kinase